MSGFLLSLHPVVASSCQYFLGDSILFKLREKKKKNLSVYVCLREETETGPESHRGTVYFGNEMSVAGGPNLLDDRTALGGGTDEKWTDSRMVILS